MLAIDRVKPGVRISIQAIALVSLVSTATASARDRSPVPIERFLQVKSSQRSTVDPVVNRYLDRISTIRADRSISKGDRQRKIEVAEQELLAELGPVLEPAQAARLGDLSKRFDSSGDFKRREPSIPLIGVSYSEYLPSNSVARSIIGRSPSSFSLSLEDIENASRPGLRFSVATDSLSVDSSGNKFFEASPLLRAEYDRNIADHFYAYARASAGPTYFDYSFNTPGGIHYGAKRLGGEGLLEVGLRYSRAQLSAEYRVMTDPSGINFNGLQVALTYVLVRFR